MAYKPITMPHSKPSKAQVCKWHSPWGTPLRVVAFVAFLNYLNHTNTRRARCAPNKHYEIPFVRGMPCSSLYPIQLITPQGYIALQVTIVFNSELCYTWSIKKRAINVSLALGSSRNNKMWWCLTCISTGYTYLYVRHFHCLFK